MQPETWTKVKEVMEACLDLDASEWPRYLDRACDGDAELRSEVESLLASHERAGDFITEPVLRESFVGSRLGQWKIVADIGEGGMSRVCLAERDDGQYHQRAAVKIIKRGMDTDLILRHFQMERQILAGMRHPNIARLLDGGVTPGGRPFFVMEHIEGEPIDRYVAANHLGTVERLRLFQQVCAAVNYAHQRLVVHRDIKPGNILVAPDGTAKLLDFGIATIVSAEPALGTLNAAQLLTPDYASPEQIRGEPVTTSSDVYSLGVLLYVLLTGERPHGLAPSAITGKQALSRDLDNIVLKALERDPQLRYSSAEQFSQDIERYLTGLPVMARAHTWSYRTSKFVTRNKFAVGAAALIFLLLTGGVAATLWQAGIAAAEHRRAEDGFFETRQLANSMLFELHDAIKDLPGSTAARALIIQRSLKYLDRISTVSPGNYVLQLESAEGYKRLGDVQGRTGSANLGDSAGASASYSKAVAMLRRPAPDAALDQKRRRLLALTLLRMGKYDGLSEALALLEALAGEQRGSGAQAELAVGYGAMADFMVERRDLPQALTFRLKERTLGKQIFDTDPTNTAVAKSYALSSKKLGALLWKMNRGPEAMGHYQTALEIEQGVAAREPGNAESRMAISFSQSDIGFLLAHEKKYAEALEHYGETVAIREELAQADPNNARAVTSLMSAYWRTAGVAVDAGRIPYGLELLNKAVNVLGRSAAAISAGAGAQTELAHVYAGYGEAYRAAHDSASARENYSRAKQILTVLRDSGKLGADGADLMRWVERELQTPRTVSAADKRQ